MSILEITLSILVFVISVVSFVCVVLQAAFISEIKEERDNAVDQAHRLHGEIRRFSEALMAERAEREPTRRGDAEVNSMNTIRDNLTLPHHCMGATLSEGEATLNGTFTAEYAPEFMAMESPKERNQWTGQDRKRS